MVIYDVSTATTPDSTIILPSQIVFPEVRYASPSGTLALGDVIESTVTLKDCSGNIKPLEFDGFRVTINDWPSDSSQEILAVLYMNFAVSKKMPAIIGE